MKISASSLNALTWTKVLETFCLKEKHWWCQNLNQILTVIRSAKMRGNERHSPSCCRSVRSPPGRAVAQIVTMYDKLQEKVDVLSHKLNSGGMTKVAGIQECSSAPTF
uniref:Uncharacterized protein n=1 Tax=Geospiza parvula TaxID=87175 RepID=A0A8U8AZU4_GEOPR